MVCTAEDGFDSIDFVGLCARLWRVYGLCGECTSCGVCVLVQTTADSLYLSLLNSVRFRTREVTVGLLGLLVDVVSVSQVYNCSRRCELCSEGCVGTLLYA